MSYLLLGQRVHRTHRESERKLIQVERFLIEAPFTAESTEDASSLDFIERRIQTCHGCGGSRDPIESPYTHLMGGYQAKGAGHSSSLEECA
jgi:hypothetical protein